MGIAVDRSPTEAEQCVIGPRRVQSDTAEFACRIGVVTIEGKGIAGTNARLVAQDAQFVTGLRVLLNQRRRAAIVLGSGHQLLLPCEGGCQVDVPENALRGC